MYSFNSLLVTAIVFLGGGIIIGYFVASQFSQDGKKQKAVKQRLEETEQKLDSYEQQVTEHFAETAKLVNTMTQSYKEVHDHLANSAMKLANVDIERQLISRSDDPDSTTEQDNEIEEASAQNVEPPKDWAPKKPGTEGTLSESYGLKEEKTGSKDEKDTVH